MLSNPIATDRALLASLIEAARDHVMSPRERYLQMVSFVVGQTGHPREQVVAILARDGIVEPM